MKTRKNADHPVAIPTTYKGIEFKSRLEAQTAFLFETFGIEWEYEPRSLMLPNGICYTPDFWLPNQHAVLECRGYKTEKGEKQILGFAAALRKGLRGNGKHIRDFFIINGNSNRVDLYKCTHDKDEEPLDGAMLYHCCVCPGWALGSFEHSGCENTNCGAPPPCCQAALVLTVHDGKLALNGRESDYWVRLEEFTSEGLVR